MPEMQFRLVDFQLHIKLAGPGWIPSSVND